MTTFQPRPPYSPQELEKLYPRDLELRMVQVVLRHGERSPVSPRFQNAGLSPYWPYCHAAQRLRSVIMLPSSTPGGQTEWNSLQWRRRLERFGEDDVPVIAGGPGNEVDGICQMGELTDKGRQTTFDLGSRLRHLYVTQLQFMPPTLESTDSIWLRTTHMPRALESVQQAFTGLYPPSTLAPGIAPPTILTRTPVEETLYPNEGNCRRFAQLARAFASRASNRWNETPEMDYLNKKLGKWMPESSPKVAVDAHPRLSGILDTTNSTLAHGKETRLPAEFYDDKVRAIVDKVVTEEWFAGYAENREYRKLGIGALAGDIVERMTSVVEQSGLSLGEIGGTDGEQGKRLGRGGETAIKLGLSGCHDTTLGGLLSAMGAFEGEKWPPYTSHIAFELFKKKSAEGSTSGAQALPTHTTPTPTPAQIARPGFIASMLGLLTSPFSSTTSTSTSSSAINRQPYTSLTPTQQSKMQDHFVRIRYNDRIMTIPACKTPGNHLEGDESFCTMEAFKRVVDGFTPKNWRDECRMNLDKPVVGVNKDGAEPAGLIELGS